MRNKVYGRRFWDEDAESFLRRISEMYDETYLLGKRAKGEEVRRRERSWSWFKNQKGNIVLRFKGKAKEMSMKEVDEFAEEVGMKKSEAFLFVKEKKVVVS